MVTAARILGDQVGSTALVFLAFLGVHVLAGLTAVITRATAALVRKGSPRHIRAGRWHYRAITVVFATATVLAAMRWRQDYYLFIIGAVAFTAATIGYPPPARRYRAHRWPGHRLRGHAHRVLCRQRPPPAPVGRAARFHILAAPLSHRRAHHRPRDNPRPDPSQALGLQKVLVTCDNANLASARTIEKVGGVLEDVRDTELGRTRRYWITL